ncbi:hypothetical protein T479_06730 [Lysinibacillus varians]|nr:hypothetical protein T479_06730 [Lysinibacillus varians]
MKSTGIVFKGEESDVGGRRSNVDIIEYKKKRSHI